jgi:hypothetical protein
MPPSTLFRAARPAFRNPNFFTQQFSRSSNFKNQFRGQSKRWQSTAAPGGQPSWFKRMWDSPIGLKTVHFWYVGLKMGKMLSDG